MQYEYDVARPDCSLPANVMRVCKTLRVLRVFSRTGDGLGAEAPAGDRQRRMTAVAHLCDPVWFR